MFVQTDERHQDDDERNELVIQLSIQALEKIWDGNGEHESSIPGLSYKGLLSELIQNNRQVFMEDVRTMTAQDFRRCFTRKPCARLMALNQQRKAEVGLSVNS